MNLTGKWDGVAVHLHEGASPDSWSFDRESAPWLCPDPRGLQICVTDWNLTEKGEWDYIVVGMFLEELLPRLLDAHIEETDDIQRALACVESLERMASAIRQRVTDIAGTKPPQPAPEHVEQSAEVPMNHAATRANAS